MLCCNIPKESSTIGIAGRTDEKGSSGAVHLYVARGVADCNFVVFTERHGEVISVPVEHATSEPFKTTHTIEGFDRLTIEAVGDE